MINPYSILVQLPQDAKCFTVLSLKDAFFGIPVHASSQYLFAFEWPNLHLGQMQQYTWTVMTKDFTKSPSYISQILKADWGYIKCSGGSTLLQYIDDLLLCSPSLLLSVFFAGAENGERERGAKALIFRQLFVIIIVSLSDF